MTETTSERSEDTLAGRASPPPALPPAEPPIGTRGVIIGTVLLGVLLLGFAFWANEAGKRAAADAPRIPQITLLTPTDGDVVEGVAALEFHTEAVLRRGPAGWETEGGGLHIHAYVDGVEVMPGSDVIERLDVDLYRWTLGTLNPGSRELRLFWADRRHREIPAGRSATVHVEVR